jgi:hypothetical protein
MITEFRTAAEAAKMLVELEKAIPFCTGPKSSKAHAVRMAAVRAERDRLAAEEKRMRETPTLFEALEAVAEAARVLQSLSFEGPTVEKYAAARGMDDALLRLSEVRLRTWYAERTPFGAWRTGRKVGRNLYRGDEPIAMLATAEWAATIAAAMNLAETMFDESPEGIDFDPGVLPPKLRELSEIYNRQFGTVGAPRDFVGAVKATAEQMIRERIGEGCCQCGKTRHEDGSAVLWLCCVCHRVVCRDCAMRIPGRVPAEYHEQTLCSNACWERAGKPTE